MISRRMVRLDALASDIEALRRFFEEFLELPAISVNAKSITYEVADVVLSLDWTFDCSTESAAERDPPGDIVLLVDEIETVLAALDELDAPFKRLDHSGTAPIIIVAASEELRFIILELSDECLMWPSPGWRTGPQYRVAE